MYQVYKIVNTYNNKYYIGIHKGDIFEDNYYGSGKYLKNALRKGNREEFKREVISTFENKELALFFEKCIVGKDLVEDENCYNLVQGGGYYFTGESHPHYNTKWPEERKKRMAEKLKGREFSDEHKEKISKAQKELYKSGKHHFCDFELTDEIIKKIVEGNKGKSLSEETKRKIGEASKKWHEENEPPMKGKTHTEEAKRKISEALKGKQMGEDNPMYGKIPTNARKVYKYGLDGVFIEGYSSVTEAINDVDLKNRSSICSVCKGDLKTAAGFQWRYFEKDKINKIKGKRRIVLQYDMDGNFIREWESIVKAKRELGFKSENISSACNGRLESSKGFKWKYKE